MDMILPDPKSSTKKLICNAVLAGTFPESGVVSWPWGFEFNFRITRTTGCEVIVGNVLETEVPIPVAFMDIVALRGEPGTTFQLRIDAMPVDPKDMPKGRTPIAPHLAPMKGPTADGQVIPWIFDRHPRPEEIKKIRPLTQEEIAAQTAEIEAKIPSGELT